MKKVAKEVDLDELFPDVNRITTGTGEIVRSRRVGDGGGNQNDPPRFFELPQDDRWESLKRKLRMSVSINCGNASSSVGEEFQWVEASSKNPEYIRLGLFSAAFYGKDCDCKIVFRRYVPLTPNPYQEYEYWGLTPRETKIPYWEVISEHFSAWTDAGICTLVKAKLERMYQAEVESVL